MNMLIKKWPRFLAAAMSLLVVVMMVSPVALADTNGQELKVTDQPDKLTLYLGEAWAGVNFELKLDSGTFPVPVVVSEEGVLTMELGGSKTYTLTCLTSGAPAPVPAEPDEAGDDTGDPDSSTPPITTDNPEEKPEGIPKSTLIIFVIGLVAAVGGLVAMYLYKRRQEYEDDYDDDEDDED